ncbi:MAG: hypothetical protein SOU32_00460 [Lachnospiraceae bacterium]|nr:hypothetical protein [Lachnospiraceae bacterium]
MFENLRTELKKRGISLKEYAEALGITERALQLYRFDRHEELWKQQKQP